MRTLIVLPAAIVLCVAVAQAKPKPSMTAPARAKIGATIHVSAKNLKRQRYAVRLFTHQSASDDRQCVAWLAKQTKRTVTHLSVDVRIPRTLSCFTGFPGTADGTMATTPGTYSVIVSVPTAINTTASAGNVVIKQIKLR